MKRAQYFGGTALVLGVLSGLGFIAPAAAQQTAATPPASPDASAAVGDEVIVTARKREERLIDVPISIQAFSAAEIKESGIDDLLSLTSRAGFQLPPVLSTSAGGREKGIIVMRGLSSSSFGDPTRDSSGGVFVDGIYVSGGQQSLNTVDVERIEVLKGPQNAYFGRNTFGGAINFITRNPSDTFGGELNVRATERGSTDFDGSIEGAIVPGLVTGRITALVHNKVAQRHAGDGGDMGAEETQSVTGTLYITPTSDLWIRLRGQFQSDEDSAANIGLIGASSFGSNCAPRTYGGFNERNGARPITLGRNYFCNSIPTIDQVGENTITASTAVNTAFINALNVNAMGTRFLGGAPNLDHSGLRRDALRFSAQSGYDFDNGASLALNIGMNQSDSLSIFDIDRTDANSFLNAAAIRSQDWTIDARALSDPSKPIRFMIGASYFWNRFQTDSAAYNYATTATTGNGNLQNVRGEVPAVYGSVDFDILENLTLTAEGRYQEDTATNIDRANNRLESTVEDFLPRVSIKYSPIEDLNVYASYSEGVQPLGFNTGYVNATAAQKAYIAANRPESASNFSPEPELQSYEVGIKQRLFDGQWQYALAVYQMDWDNAITASSLFNPAPCLATTPQTALTAACPLTTGGTSLTTGNNARIRGLELEVSGEILPGWTVDGTLDYKDPEWKKYANSGFNAFAGLTQPGDIYRGDGNKLAKVPEWSGTLSSTYTGTINSDWNYYVRGDVLYTGKAWDSDINIVETDPYTRVNSRVGIKRDNLTLELFANNLFDDDHWDYAAPTVELSGNFTQRALLVLPAQRREVGVRAQVKF